MIAFGIFFLLCYLTFSEINTGRSRQGSAILYKRGARAAKVIDQSDHNARSDEEKGKQEGAIEQIEDSSREENGKNEEALRAQPKMINTFSWDSISYTVTVSGEKRLLLDKVSGFVAPGKLTALMGESGAGKVRLFQSSLSY